MPIPLRGSAHRRAGAPGGVAHGHVHRRHRGELGFGRRQHHTARSLLHTYTQQGTLKVKQTVTNPQETNFICQNIAVGDVTPPSGNILINGGAALTNSTAVTLNVSVDGADPGSKMRFYNGDQDPPDPASTYWSAWEPLAATKAWGLTLNDGEAYVWAQFKDSVGNPSSITGARIALDTTPPGGSIAISSGANYARTAAVTLNLWADDGNGSGVTSMWLYNMSKNISGEWVLPSALLLPSVPYAATTAWSLSEGDGPKRVAVFFGDAAGNVSTRYTADINLDSTKPAGFSISINGGAPYTRTAGNTISVQPPGEIVPGTITMSLGKWVEPTGISWGAWEPFAFTRTLDIRTYLSPPVTRSPNRTVYARFQDYVGNISATVSDGIDLDNQAPVNGTLTAIGGEKQVELNWSGFSDGVSGIWTYKLYCSTRGVPDVTKDPLLYRTGDTSFTHQNLQKGRRYYYRVVAIDYAGNVSTGATAQARTKGGTSPALLMLLGN
jgi:hypothetical protein